MGNVTDSQFTFVTYEGPTLPRDAETRSVIRRRAMRDVAAARKKTGSYKQHPNRRQYPVFIQSPSVPTVAADDHALLLSLAPLTGLRLGLATCGPDIPGRVRLGSTKIFSFIPSRYGQVPALSYATDCVVAKRRSMILGESGKHVAGLKALAQYSKALRALQVALDDEKQRCSPETLCATQLLGMFELLSTGGKAHSWLRHIGGATRLMQVRGFGAFEDEFELALLTAHIGPAVTEAFLSNKPCFLAELQWQHLLRNAIIHDESLSGYTNLILPLWEHIVGGPAQFMRATDLICSRTLPHRDAIEDLIGCLMRARTQLLEWLEMAQHRIGLSDQEIDGPEWRDSAVFPPTDDPNTGDDGIQIALRGTFTTCRLLKARLLVALDPVRFHHLETECQELAARITRLGDYQHRNGSLVASLFMSQGTWIAQSVLDTREIWDDNQSLGHQGVIERSKFEAWCEAMGMIRTWNC